MYAIVNIAGQQYKVEKDQKLFVHRLEGKEGQALQFDEVLLIDNDKDILIGEPIIKGAMITGKVLSHAKGDKVQVFKKKKRKGYRVLRGHRQFLTEIQIQDIIEKGAVKEAKTQAAGKEAAAGKPVPASKSASAEKKSTAEKKPSAAKGTTGSGTAAKKTSAKKSTAGTGTAAKPAAKKSTGTAAKKTSGTAAKKTSGTAAKKPSADKKKKE